MFKKSFIIIAIQVLGILLSLVTMYFIVGGMGPEFYSLVGINTIIVNIILTFSHLGLETVMMREALYWQKNNDIDKIEEYTTQSIISRIFGTLILSPFLITYLWFINESKYSGQETLLFVLFFVGATVSSLNNAMTLIVRAQGGYVFAQAASIVNSYALRFLGLGLYFYLGSRAYLYFVGLSSIPLAFVYFIKLRKYISFKYINFRDMLKKIRDSKYLWLKSYLDYIKGSADSLLVSAIFPSTIMGSYTVFKHIEGISKNFIEGFFDVLSQNTVKYKGDEQNLIKQERKIKQAIYLSILIIIILTCIFMVNPTYFIKLTNLNKYAHMNLLLFCVSVISILYLIGKYEINAIGLFATSKFNFRFGLITFAVSILSFFSVAIIPNLIGMSLQRIFVYALTSIFAIIFFRKNRKEYYSEIKK